MMSKIRNIIKSRVKYGYFLIFLILFIIIVYIALYVNDTFIRPYFGDVLVVIAIYFFLCSFLKNIPKLLPLYVFLFASLVELLQFINILGLIGLSQTGSLSILTGATFDFADILCYASGCVLTAFFQILVKTRSKKR